MNVFVLQSSNNNWNTVAAIVVSGGVGRDFQSAVPHNIRDMYVKQLNDVLEIDEGGSRLWSGCLKWVLLGILWKGSSSKCGGLHVGAKRSESQSVRETITCICRMVMDEEHDECKNSQRMLMKRGETKCININYSGPKMASLGRLELSI